MNYYAEDEQHISTFIDRADIIEPAKRDLADMLIKGDISGFNKLIDQVTEVVDFNQTLDFWAWIEDDYTREPHKSDFMAARNVHMHALEIVDDYFDALDKPMSASL
ncbi:MAG: hypothetical protein HRU12_02865 [Phaeodactylibacter sp.]|nr:hypothetical protein [Phaeodactylibacter sp.]